MILKNNTIMREISFNEVKAKLYAAGLRITQQRIMIYKELHANKNHPTAEDLFKNLKSRVTGLSLATVYKNLDAFVKRGLAIKIKSNDDSVHYDADVQTHNHMVCTKTNSIMDFHDTELNELLMNYMKSKEIKNFKIKDVQIQFVGEKV